MTESKGFCQQVPACPLVSVIIPSFNASRYLAEAVNSVLAQDYPNKEVIVVDDGSTDDTLGVVSDFGSLITVISQGNCGAAAARNKGLKVARGVYVAFLDADDRWFPRKLSRQVRYLEANSQVGMVYSRWDVWHGNSSTPLATYETEEESIPADSVEEESSGWLYHLLLFDSIIHTSSVLIRRSVIEQVGLFHELLRNGQDYDYWLRVSRICEIHKLAATLSIYRLHPENNTRIPKDTNYEYTVVKGALERWGDRGPDGSVADRRAMKQRLARLCFNFGYTHYWRGNPRLAKASFKEGLRYKPLWPKSWTYYILASVKSLPALLGRRENDS